jgi:phosphoadenosine phosphosulfate reductase
MSRKKVDNKRVLIELDIDNINEPLSSISATERIEWALNTFKLGLFAMTSAGIDSALMINHLKNASQYIPVIHINTGFLPEETIEFSSDLEKMYGHTFFEFGPSDKEITDIKELHLWDGDLAEYSRITKLKPLKKAIKDLGVKALLTGIRGDQTVNRSSLRVVEFGNNNEIRINPFIDWTQEMVDDYISRNKLPRNPLYKKGFGSAGDINTTQAGSSRNGRKVMECGLHVKNGKLVRNN